MFDPVRTRVLQLFRVPHDPDPPAGAQGSVRIFRAARNFYKLRLLRWGIGQVAAFAGIVFSLAFLEQMQGAIEEVRAEVRLPVGKTAPSPPPAADPRDSRTAQPAAESPQRRVVRSRSGQPRAVVRRVAERWPWWLFPLLTIIEWIGVLLYLLQIPITYAMARLDYELRWYIVTDRSLRIRAGLASVQETTMSFANIQQVVVSQGPLQRLLGIADLRVQSAGGGGGSQHEHGGRESLHTGIFHGVDNANEIRDLILERLRIFRQAGLGDPDEIEHSMPAPVATSVARLAAQELLQEARALRRTIR